MGNTKRLQDISAAILAGGMGTRLRSVLGDRPKVLAEIRGRPFLAFLLDDLASAGLKYVVLCTGYLGEQIEAALGSQYGPLSLIYSQETVPLGTGGALRLAIHLLLSDPVLVMNGDSYCATDLEAFRIWHSERKAAVTLLLTEVLDATRYGGVQTDRNGMILNFEEKREMRAPGWINAGIYLFSRESILSIPENREVSLEKEIFPSWIGRRFYGFKAKGRFLDIGIPEDYAAAENFFLTLKAQP
jgi:NDP-sugar pyrophosphorylase family protein